MSHPLRVRGLPPVIALALILFWLALTVHFNYAGNWTGLFCTGGLQKLPPQLAATTHTFANSWGYDGQFYRYVAHDPFFQNGLAAYVDNPRFRYRRGFLSLAAWTLAFGQQNWIDAAYIGLVIAASVLGVYWCASYLAFRGANAAWSLLFLILPSTVTSVDRMLTDGCLGALFAAFVYYVSRAHWKRAYTVSALALLTRETGLLLIAGLVMYWLVRRRLKLALVCATAVLPAVAWYAFVQFNTAPNPVPGAIAFPFAAWFAAFSQTLPGTMAPLQAGILRASYTAGLLGLAGTTILAVLCARNRGRGAVEIAVIFFAAMVTVLGPVVMIDPYSYGRAASPLMLFLMLEAACAGVYGALLPPFALSCAVGVLLSGQVAVVLKAVFGIQLRP